MIKCGIFNTAILDETDVGTISEQSAKNVTVIVIKVNE